MRNKYIWISGVLILATFTIVVIFSVKRWKDHIVSRQNQFAKTRVNELILQKEFETAWQVLQRIPKDTQNSDLAHLRVETVVGRRNLEDLAAQFRSLPESILAHEKASLLLARSFAHQREDEAFYRILNHWSQRASDTNKWISLEIDHKLLSGDISAAWERLAQIDLHDSLQPNQLIQRAMIRAKTNSVAALKDLNLAFSLNSRSPETRSFRAQILESMGDNDLARVEYIAAHLAEPNNSLWRDQLGEFYRRHQQFDFALRTWAAGEVAETPDYIWLKSAFWSRVAVSNSLPKSPRISTGNLSNLASMILALPEGQFWNETAFLALNNHEHFRRTRQEVYWLSILQAIKDRNEQSVRTLLRSRPFRTGLWDVYLHEALSSIIRYRRTGRFTSIDYFKSQIHNNTGSQHLLFGLIKGFQRQETIQQQKSTVAPELQALFKGPNAFTAALIASGWQEAALHLFESTPDTSLSNYPSWFHYGLGQIKRYNDSPEVALTYLQAQKSSDDLQLLIAEILIGLQRIGDAHEILKSLSLIESPEGSRAAWLLAIHLLQEKRFDEAVNFIVLNPNLGETIQGQELRAKAAELTGDLDTAAAIYLAISGDSAQASRFLADQAFRAKDYQTSRQFTLALLQQNPGDLKIMANLRAIDSAINSIE